MARIIAGLYQNMNTLIKQANNRLLGNLYLHLISEYFYIFLQNNNLLNYLDGEYSADNYDGIIIFSSSFNLNFSEIIKNFLIKQSDVLRAILRTSYNKKRNPSYDIGRTTQELINLHQQPSLQHFITAPISPASCTLKTPYFSLSNKINHNLIDLDIILEINLTDDFLKPLASIVLNALSNILESYIYTMPNFTSYVYHEQWSDYQCDPTYIGLKLQLRTSNQSQINIKTLTNYLNNQLSKIKQLKFSEKLLSKIQLKSLLLTNEELLTSSGFIVTDKYWEKISLKDINRLYSSIHIVG